MRKSGEAAKVGWYIFFWRHADVENSIGRLRGKLKTRFACRSGTEFACNVGSILFDILGLAQNLCNSGGTTSV
jgi:hypothetical protein